MGLGANLGRLMLLIGRKHDSQFKLQLITEKRLFLANRAAFAMQVQARVPGNLETEKYNSDPNVRWAQQVNAEVAQIDKMLEMEQKRVDIELQAITQEISGVEKLAQQETQTFKYGGVG